MRFSIKDFSFGSLNLGDIDLTNVTGIVDGNRDLMLNTEGQQVSVMLGPLAVNVNVTLFEGESGVRLVNPDSSISPATPGNSRLCRICHAGMSKSKPK